ncbi:zinc transporter ZntB [Aquabacter spiritensis]|uniref:Zinc transporter n=1 Tax=Aquabacter spiritensis TaxID=933073 RepID=A0A4V2UXC7_9HYPH|nr:zinc transporter ZntB [Aquabacter spiritensis]TCT02988.1 zinc transporter [Aquabacter spiritensis]
MSAPDTEGLLEGWQFDGRGGGRRLDWDEVRNLGPIEEGFVWLHFRRLQRSPQDWLCNQSGIDPLILEGMLEDESRPRCSLFADSAFLVLRAVNLHRNALPEDLLGLHMWVDARRIITLQHEPISAIADYVESLGRARCPRTQGEMVSDLGLRLVDRLDPVISALMDEADELEDAVEKAEARDLLPKLAILRRLAIKLRRHIAPQREALNHFSTEDDPWLGPKDRTRLRDAADRVARFTEELDSIRERAALIRDQMVDRRAEQMNKSMLVLAVVTVVFAPLTFVSGLFGMNVGGIPGVDDPESFWLISALLIALALSLAWLFRRLRWV